LKKAADLIPLGAGEPVTIEALPTKIFDILSRTQISLSSKSGARIPITRHGNGAQSLAVICLFDAFLQSRLESSYGEHAEPLLALEEPEAHLHPSAAKAVGTMLQTLSGQKIITTHSGDLLAGVPLTKIRRLSRRNGEIRVHQIGEGVFTKEELRKLDYQVRLSRGSLLFSRCWLLVEGETEGTLLPECARILGCDLDAEGISCIEFSQVGVEKIIKLADQLGIAWFVVADNDQAGLSYETSAKSQLDGRPASDHIKVLDHGDMEVFLCIEGFGSIYEASVASQKSSQVKATKGTSLYWKQVTDAQSKNAKPRNALAVVDEMAKQGKAGVPTLLSNIIGQTQTLARSNG
ncbi:ATP-dependent endonuclease, partial [Acidocella sp. MX-AZ02]|uniref:ATP-dependent nuclease n=1 Tax=Acidocella sp. MX-AZ02 TaxID=1214225 RepID=UPI00028EDD69